MAQIRLSALTMAAEVIDWRRFATAPAFIGFAGQVPAEYSSGDAALRGHITKAGSRAAGPELTDGSPTGSHPAAPGILHHR